MNSLTYICDECGRQSTEVVEYNDGTIFICCECNDAIIKKGLESLQENKGLKTLRMFGRVGESFVKGFASQLKDPGTMTVATGLGLQQGLKYKGNVKRGMLTGVIVLGVVGSINGVVNVFRNIDYIKQA